jgi:hypothetical protein
MLPLEQVKSTYTAIAFPEGVDVVTAVVMRRVILMEISASSHVYGQIDAHRTVDRTWCTNVLWQRQ